MKYFSFMFLVLLIFTSCDSDNPCFGKSGEHKFKTMQLSSFNEIDIPKGFTVEIIESTESKIEINSYENYLPNLDFKVSNNVLIMTNEMSCSLLHTYEIAKVRIYTPTLKSIKSRTQLKVSSVGVLTFPELFIITSVEDGASSYFDLNISNEVLKIEDNQIGFFMISGKTNWFDVSLFGGNGRVEAQDFKAFDCSIFHRSSNDVFLHVENKLSGTIYTTGNLYLYSKPNEVDVKEIYKGKLIYK